MKELEVLQYYKVIDINMVYYKIQISPKSRDMETIETKFENSGKIVSW